MTGLSLMADRNDCALGDCIMVWTRSEETLTDYCPWTEGAPDWA